MGRRMRVRLALVLLLGMGILLPDGLVYGQGQGAGRGRATEAASGQLRPPPLTVQAGPTPVTKTVPFLSSGALSAAQAALGVRAADERLEGADAAVSAVLPTTDLGASPGSLGCSQRAGQRGPNPGAGAPNGNRRVAQDCSFRRQAETDIVYNPAEPTNLLAGQNDSRVGFNQCGIDWSTDNGSHWGDMLPPFRQVVNNPAGEEPTATDPNRHTLRGGAGTFHTYDAASDPAVAFDSRGRGFFSCIAFDLFSNASMLFVVESPEGAHGSFFYTIPTFGRQFVVVEDNSPLVFHDKEFIAADRYPASPNRDNVYVTWTAFHFGCGPAGYCQAPIYGAMSTDHGVTWSTPEQISGVNPQLCLFGNFFDPTLPEHACNFDQGSDPEVLPNGDLVVAFLNANTPTVNNQQLAVHCRPTGSSPAGTAHLNCGAPAKIGDDVAAGEPLCDFGRGPEYCIPGAYIRTNDFPRIAVNTENGHLYVVWQDYRNQEYDIQLAASLDGGLTWAPSVTVNPDSSLDHYFPAVDIAEVGGLDRVGVSYYRTERVANENTTPLPGGFKTCNPAQVGYSTPCSPGVGLANSDYVLAGGRASEAPYDFRVVSPVFPPPDGIQTGFNGDYSGLTINRGTEAHPLWSDTRNVDPYAPADGVVRDEDVFTDTGGLPDGRGRPSTGQIGRQ